MSDAAAEGSVVQTDVAAPAGNPETQQAEGANGSAPSAANSWLDGLSEDNRKLAEDKGWKAAEDIDKAFTSYRELERRQGELIRIPEDDAPPEERDKLYAKLGRPEAPDKYEFKRTDGLPEDLPWNSEGETRFKQWAFENGLSARQAQGILDKFALDQANQFTQEKERLGKAVEAAHDDLVKEWGPTDSEGFKAKQALMDRAAGKLGLKEALQQGGLILPDGAVTNSQLAKALAAVGETMFKEDVVGADGAPQFGNPFKKDANGGRNISAISALKRSDPERARRMAREAGEDPRDWGL